MFTNEADRHLPSESDPLNTGDIMPEENQAIDDKMEDEVSLDDDDLVELEEEEDDYSEEEEEEEPRLSDASGAASVFKLYSSLW